MNILLNPNQISFFAAAAGKHNGLRLPLCHRVEHRDHILNKIFVLETNFDNSLLPFKLCSRVREVAR